MNGSASEMPVPRRNALRGKCQDFIAMVSISSLKLFALNDVSNKCRDGVATFFETINQEIHQVFVVVSDIA